MRGCIPCRLRHLKCDKSGPNCLRCLRSGRECVPAPREPEVAFRHGHNPSFQKIEPPKYGESDISFPENQVWVGPSSDYSFKDETVETAAEYCVISETDQPLFSSSSSRAPSASSSPRDPAVLGPSTAVPQYVADSRSGSRSNSTNSPWPSSAKPAVQSQLESVSEAYLLRHFQQHLASWLDAGDPEGHIYSDVAGRASQSPLLLYACLAVSACHLSRTGSPISPEVADSYHERCVSIMLPALENSKFEIGIDILLSSTVVLRFFEQMTSRIPSNDPQRHLLAGSVYISSHVDCAISDGLASASFWVFVIQDIQFALTYQKCLRITFAPFDDRLRRWWATKPVLSVGDWVNRAVWLLAETIDFCYNVSGLNYGGHLGIAGEVALKKRILDWEIGKPDTFIPLHVSPRDPERGKPFPVVWYTNLWHSTAVQHVCLAKTLMLIREIEVHDGSKLCDEQRLKTKELIEENLYYLFGITLSADDEPSLRVMACHALSACSSWIEDPIAQRSLLDLLRRTDRENGWPWAYVEKRILQTWQGSPL